MRQTERSTIDGMMKFHNSIIANYTCMSGSIIGEGTHVSQVMGKLSRSKNM